MAGEAWLAGDNVQITEKCWQVKENTNYDFCDDFNLIGNSDLWFSLVDVLNVIRSSDVDVRIEGEFRDIVILKLIRNIDL